MEIRPTSKAQKNPPELAASPPKAKAGIALSMQHTGQLELQEPRALPPLTKNDIKHLYVFQKFSSVEDLTRHIKQYPNITKLTLHEVSIQDKNINQKHIKQLKADMPHLKDIEIEVHP